MAISNRDPGTSALDFTISSVLNVNKPDYSQLYMFCYQYKARCYMMLKSLKSCKRELKVLASAVGMVRIGVTMNYIITTNSMLICIIYIEVFMNYVID